jgi:hypothetical protein
MNQTQTRMEYKGMSRARKETGMSYIGMVNNSTKHEKAYNFNELVYTIYLAPADKSGFEVCPMRTKECTETCLDESGRNRMDVKEKRIDQSRIKKTKLFFQNREYFVRWVIDEIKQGINKANKLGYRFSVRLNNTSDLSPESFYINDNGVKRNLLQLFPNVTFYDYTKVRNRFRVLKKYPNYDITFSYSGENMSDCIDLLKNGERVAMVFKKVPTTYMGYPVIDGDQYDMRYLDDKGVIIGLKFKKVRNKLQSDNKFVIQD